MSNTQTNQSKELQSVLDEAIIGFEDAYSACKEERDQAVIDRRFAFKSGAMWEGEWGERWGNKPKLEFNKIQVSIRRALKDYSENQVSPIFNVIGGGDPAFGDVCADLFRADESTGLAKQAMKNAFTEAVTGGFGAWRLCAEYEDEESDIDDQEDDEERSQRIRFVPIFDADRCVFFGTNSKRPDKSDATQCWVLTGFSRDAYKAKWGDDPATWPNDVNKDGFDWATPDLVYVAEYYTRKLKSYTIRVFGMPNVEGVADQEFEADELEENPEIEQDLKAQGFIELRQRKFKRWEVRKYILSRGKVLDDCGVIAGRAIPVIPIYCNYVFIDGKESYSGMVRYSKDQARLDNMTRTKLAMISAVSSFSKPIFTREQIAGLDKYWSGDAKEEYAYLVANKLEDVTGNPILPNPAFTQPPQVPPATVALLQACDQDRRDMLGDYSEPEKVTANTSGYAMEIATASLSDRNYTYLDSFADAKRRCAEVWLGMAKDVYIEDEREMDGVNERGAKNPVVLNQPYNNGSGTVLKNSFNGQKIRVNIDMGPSSKSKRDALVRSLLAMRQIETDPQNQAILSAEILRNAEGEGMLALNEFFRKKLVEMGVEEPTAEDQERMQQVAQEQANQPPDPQTQLLQAAAQSEMAKAEKAQADTVLTAAKTKETEAKIAQMLAGISDAEQQRFLEGIRVMLDLRNAQSAQGQMSASSDEVMPNEQ